jgi:hypothetical protein
MKFYDVVLARTYQGKFELIAVEYETIGRITMLTKRAERKLAKYYEWKVISQALDNPHFQSEFQRVFGGYYSKFPF